MKKQTARPAIFLGVILATTVLQVVGARPPVFEGVDSDAGAQPAEERRELSPVMDCSLRARRLASEIVGLAGDGALPEDLAAVARSIAGGDDPAKLREAALSTLVSPAHAGLVSVPAQVTAEWIDGQSSYRYLGSSDVRIQDIPDWSTLVIAHQRLEAGHRVPPSAQNPEGEVFTLAFVDGHVEVSTRAHAEAAIEASVRTLDAIRHGTQMPDEQQVIFDLTQIMRGVRAYAAAHGGLVPATLGLALEYVPGDTPRTSTPAKCARLFLSPRAKKETSVPEAPTPEWVDANSSYVYLGREGLALARVPLPDTIVLLHGRTDQGVETKRLDGTLRVMIPVATAQGSAALRTREYAGWIVRESELSLAAVQVRGAGEAPRELPAWVHAGQDVRTLSAAIVAYRAKHDDELPPTLSATLAYLPEWMTPAERARVYLSPNAEASEQLPAAGVGAWIDAHASYSYLARGGMLPDERSTNLLLLHAPLDQAYTMQLPGAGEDRVVACADCMGFVGLLPKEWVEERAAASRKTLEALGGAR